MTGILGLLDILRHGGDDSASTIAVPATAIAGGIFNGKGHPASGWKGHVNGGTALV